MRGILFGIIAASIFWAAVVYVGPQFIPDADHCYLVGTGDNQSFCLNRLHATADVAAFIGWSIGLVIGVRT